LKDFFKRAGLIILFLLIALGVVIFAFNIGEARGYELAKTHNDKETEKHANIPQVEIPQVEIQDIEVKDTAICEEKEIVVSEAEKLRAKIKTNKKEVSLFCDDWFKDRKRRNRKSADRFIEIVAEETALRGIDPLAVSMVISRESAWMSNVIGKKRNERGLMQVHGVAAKGFDISTPRGQIQAGVNHLRVCLDKCGDYDGAFRCYATRGHCNGRWKKARERFEQYNRAVALFRDVE
jgi:hypothetical protein